MSITIDKGNNTPTIFCYDGRSLPKLAWHEYVKLRYHAEPIRIRSIYTGTVSDCDSYLTYDGHVIGSIFDPCIRHLDKLAQKQAVYIYGQAHGYNKRGWPQLFASLPSERRLMQLSR